MKDTGLSNHEARREIVGSLKFYCLQSDLLGRRDVACFLMWIYGYRLLQIPYCYLPEPLIKTTSEWLSHRPVEALSKFTVWLLKELLDEPQPKKGAGGAPSKAKVNISLVHSFIHSIPQLGILGFSKFISFVIPRKIDTSRLVFECNLTLC